MFSIIVDQLRFKKLPIGSYDRISTMLSWIWMVLIGAVVNSVILIHEKNILMFVVTVVVQIIEIYIAYLVMAWWLHKKVYGGIGNLWGLVATASSIDIIVPFVALIHPIGLAVFGVVSLAVFFNALKNGLDLTVKTTLVSIIIVMVSVIVLSVLIGIIAAIAGVQMPESM